VPTAKVAFDGGCNANGRRVIMVIHKIHMINTIKWIHLIQLWSTKRARESVVGEVLLLCCCLFSYG
jgi:hypothetical protein